MATQFAGKAQEVAYKLTADQIAHAMELASNSGYNHPADPAFVSAVLIALATNLQTADGALRKK
ncbi:hypothetical protein [Variovorax sp.]|uniref:hypothetical protein n=1 Tax=Variovorax sp. TaxID=1871043 RepID=UPI003BAAC769